MEQLPLSDNSQKEKMESDEAHLKNLHDMLSQAMKKSGNVEKLYNSISEFALGLEKKHPDARSRRLWHLLIFSTPLPGMNMNMEDYPGEDSIVRFIEGLN